jgi:hypothetical protein
LPEQSKLEQAASPAISERIQKCLTEIDSLIHQGVEHPRYEFKRAASITREDLELKEWLKANASHTWFSYIPDLFAHTLELIVPMAERLYDVVLSQDSSASPYEQLPKLFATEFKNKTRDQRLFLYGEFLDNVKTWQAHTMRQEFRRFPFMFSWQGRLGEIVQKCRDTRPKK